MIVCAYINIPDRLFRLYKYSAQITEICTSSANTSLFRHTHSGRENKNIQIWRIGIFASWQSTLKIFYCNVIVFKITEAISFFSVEFKNLSTTKILFGGLFIYFIFYSFIIIYKFCWFQTASIFFFKYKRTSILCFQKGVGVSRKRGI